MVHTKPPYKPEGRNLTIDRSVRAKPGRARKASPPCSICEADATFLRSSRPPYEALRPRIRVVDLFAGCGGLTLGVAEEARRAGLGIDVRLAVDSDSDAVAVYHANFPEATLQLGSVEALFDGIGGSPPTRSETRARRAVGRLDILLGGPPCQGHSNLNNLTRRDDPRNALYARMARAAEVLKPKVVLIENVPSVKHDVSSVVDLTVKALVKIGYRVSQAVIDLTRLGAPQRRRRHVVFASRLKAIDPSTALSNLGQRCPAHTVRSVRWAIGDLASAGIGGAFDKAGKLSSKNARRIRWLFEKNKYDLPNHRRPTCHRSDHSYRSMYGRLAWNGPAQTVTTGFGSMGQGRYVHPSRRRTITPHEAARLQLLPDFLDFSSVTERGSLARLIGNAVPPALASAILREQLNALRPALPAEQTRPQARRGRTRRRTRVNTKTLGRVPAPSSPEARRRMQATRQRGTSGERLLRSQLDKLRLKYHVDKPLIQGLQRRADVVFPTARVAVFVDGCFWHGCPTHATFPKANRQWWRAKLLANRRRDTDTDRRLHESGWVVLRFWEHEDAALAGRAVAAAVAGRLQVEGEQESRMRSRT